MTEDDRERIVRALERQAMGLELSAQDRWCLKAHARHEQREHSADGMKLDTDMS
jgi:hypothetical protein